MPCDPARSEFNQPPASPPKISEGKVVEPVLKEHPVLSAKRALIEKIKLQREAAARIETAFVDTAKTIRNVEKKPDGQSGSDR